MTYQITGLKREDFASLFEMDDADLVKQGARRVVATSKPGFPCRVSLQDAELGESLILFNHVSHDVATPYRSSYAIFVRENGEEVETYTDTIPPVFEGRPMAFRGFDAAGMLVGATLALPGQADAKIRELFVSGEIAYIHAHNAAHGCFSARIDRSDNG